MNRMKNLGIAAVSLLFLGCSTSSSNPQLSAVNPAQAQGQTFTQVEFLARPAVGEGLFLKNDSQNTYNSVGPAFIGRALANPQGPEGKAAASTLADGLTILTALVALKPPGSPLTVQQLVTALLPDVQRIDTTLSFLPVNNVEVRAYAAQANAIGSPCSGRKLTDDTIDVTLNLLTGGTLGIGNAGNGFNAGDGVPYYRPAGNTNPAIGHHLLNGQAVPYGASTFPFLAPPQ